MTNNQRRLRRLRARRSRPRRGVLLLMVLSLLVLFLLVGTSFLLIGGQYRTAAKAIERANRTTFQPADLMERVLMQVVRDTQNRHSALRYHSLLRDLYGVDGFVGRVLRRSDVLSATRPEIINVRVGEGSATIELPLVPRYVGIDPTVNFGPNNDGLGETRGQAIEFYVVDVQNPADPASRLSENNAVGLDFDQQGFPLEHTLSSTNGHYEGSLLTFLEGPCQGQTVRVLGYDIVPAQVGTALDGFEVTVTRWRVSTPPRADGSPLRLGPIEFRDLVPPNTLRATQFGLTDLVQDNSLGVRFMVNGRPLNGAGVGLNPLALSHDFRNGVPAARNSALELFDTLVGEQYGLELALTPNSTYYNETANVHLNPSVGTDPWAAGLTAGDLLPLTRGFAAGAVSLHRTFAGPGDTDESYDAADYQNMALAAQPLERRLRGRVATLDGTGRRVLLDPDAFYAGTPGGTPDYLDLDGVPIPSLHRPSLANFWFHRLLNSSWLTTLIPNPSDRVRAILRPYNDNGTPRTNLGLNAQNARQIAAIKRKFMMRPLRDDHPNFDGSNPLSRYSTTALRNALGSANLVNTGGEITFPFWEAVGPWDVDNDGDGVPDSVWVDLGLPVQQTEDGRFYKPMVAILVEDLDGRLNLNAHGSAADLATADATRLTPVLPNNLNTEDLDQSNLDDLSGNPTPLNTNLAHDFVNGATLVSSNQLPPGEGWGPAEVSLRSLLSPSLPLDELLGIDQGGIPPNGSSGNPLDVGYTGNPQYDDYARVLYGRPDPADPGFRPRGVAAALREQTIFGRYGSGPGSTTTPSPTTPGVTLTGLPLGTPSLTAPGVTLTGVPLGTPSQISRDRRTPQEFFMWPAFTDAIDSSSVPVRFENPFNEPLSGFSSPPNLASRYAGAGLTAAGAPVIEPYDEARTATAEIQQGADNLREQDFVASWRELFFTSIDDSPYELDLSPASRRLPPTSLSAIGQSYLGTAPIDDDSPFSPAELERILRAFDADAETLPDRLWRTLDATDPAKLAAASSPARPGNSANQSVATNIRNGEAVDNPNFIANSLDNVVAATRAAVNRRQMTTDSWDLPTPNENWTERLILGADGFPGVPWRDTNLNARRDAGDDGNDDSDTGIGLVGVDDDNDGTIDEPNEVTIFDEGDEAIPVFNPGGTHTFSDGAEVAYDDLFGDGCDDYVVVMRDDPPSPGRITDYLRYRVVLELKRQGLVDADVAHIDPTVDARVRLNGLSLPQAVNNIIFGDNTVPSADPNNPILPNPALTNTRYSFGGLLAPELLAGLRMDLNRPLGDGRDNNGNGVVDEPAEAGEPYTFTVLGGQLRVRLTPDPPAFRDLNANNRLDQDLDGDGVLFVDTDNDGAPDRFDFNGQVVDSNGDGIPERFDFDGPAVDNDGDGRDEQGDLEHADANFDGILDMADLDQDGTLDPVFEPTVDHVWVDDDGDGLRDPGEFRPFDYTRGADANGSGGLVNATTGVRDDARMARQLYARHLYVLMLLLTDENYLAPYDAHDPQVRHYIDPLSGSASGNEFADDASFAFRHAFEEFGGDPSVPTTGADEERRLIALNNARRAALRKLTRRKIAQWVINVVDFRDPDAIQTPFEYDENPWDGWNIVNGAQILPLDGDLTTDENHVQRRSLTAGEFGLPTPEAIDVDPAALAVRERTRGVVWGAERPEVLLTEGVAWHDRRLEDLGAARDGTVDDPTPENRDDDLDQLRKPRGPVFLEATNPWQGDTQRPAEFYSHVDRDGNFTRDEGVRFDRLSTAPADPSTPATALVTRSPVWRISVVEEHPLVRNATLPPPQDGLITPDGAALQPAAPSVDDLIGGNTADPLALNYLGLDLVRGPWVYATSVDPSPTSLAPPLNYGSNNLDQPSLPNAYRQYLTERDQEALYTLLSPTLPEGDLGFDPSTPRGAGQFDADGIFVPFGLIERAPTIPDPSFPAFDRFAQPSEPASLSVPVTTTVDPVASGDLSRQVALKPTTFLERVFYMVPASPLSERRDIAAPAPVPLGNLVDPGYRTPELFYDLDLSSPGAVDGNTGLRVGVEETGGMLRVHVSKFANGFDRTDLDGDGNRVDFDSTTPGNQPVPLAPLLPGRRAMIGTTGDVHEDTFSGTPVGNINPPNPEDFTTSAYPLTFLEQDARGLDKRYVTLMSRPASESENDAGSQLLGSQSRPSLLTGTRRLEMIPSPDPEDHQFAVRMNGLYEALSLLDGDEGVNATLGEGLTGSPALLTTQPVIAVPIDHMSISEPVDEYLLRQLELDRTLGRLAFPSTGSRPNGEVPVEEYFGTSEDRDGQLHFDEPFDVLPELIENQTTVNYRSVHLERLANPLLPWNPPPVRPNGEDPEGRIPGTSQHNPNLPVNPYLPVDAQSLDLTAFNGYSNQENLVTDPSRLSADSDFVADVSVDSLGPEVRHRRKRGQPGVTIDATESAGGVETQAAIGFVSNDRGRPLGPFPKLWLYEPGRLLWRQSGAATLTEIAHQYAEDVYNGYLAGEQDRISPDPGSGNLRTNNLVGTDGTLREAQALGNANYQTAFVDFPWRMSLGLASFWSGEFYTGEGLRWFADNGVEGPAQQIDLDGDGTVGDLVGRAEVTRVNDTIADDGRTAEAFAADFSTLSLDTRGGGTVNAREFFEEYLSQHASLNNHTTPAFHWPNRPLASAGELLQVPVWGGSRMLTYYSVFNWQRTQLPFFEHRQQVNPYNGEAGVDFDHDGLDYSVANGVSRQPFTFDGDFGNDFNPGADTDGDGYVDVSAGDASLPVGALIVDRDNRPEEGPTNVLRWRETLGHFGHLMNFFQTARFPATVLSFARERVLGDSSTNEEFVVPQGAPHFYRLLDYVHTPSRFTATDTLLNQDVFGLPGLVPGDVREEFAAPFNRVSTYREPGRVNLNTIAGRGDDTEPADRWSEVYDGLMHRVQDASLIDYDLNTLLQMGHLGPAWRDVELSRRGYVQPEFDPTTDGGDSVDYSPGRLHPDFPTRFANPFRAPGEGANVPLAGMVQTGVDATLLRAHPLSPGADGAWGSRGLDEATVDKSGAGGNGLNNGVPLPDDDGVRDDASEAGFLTLGGITEAVTLELGGGNVSGTVPAQTVSERLRADAVLARFQSTSGRRGRLPDTFMLDAFRPTTTDVNPRNITARESRTNGIANAEISKRATPVPLFSGASLEPSLDTERNSTTRYQPIQRLSNLATTRSNVYAIWITVGFFEVTQAADNPQIAERYFNPVDANGDGSRNEFLGATPEQQAQTAELFSQVYPDGWTLGSELGFDTGTNRRHRGFYVVDRSLPVGFRPGEDLNASETVLVRRRIE